MWRQNRTVSPRNTFTIKDVEGNLSYFSGDDKLPIENWITEFDDMSTLLQWNDLQKLIYGKRMLKGSAKKYISYEEGITSWSTMKHHLKREFKVRLNSATVHSQLYKRKCQLTESSRQYIYAMQEIADQGHIEENALIQYIIDGIPDDECSKTMLYNAKTLRELKKLFEVYDHMKEKMQRKKTSTRKDGTKENIKDAKNIRQRPSSKQIAKKHCFNCGSTEHDVKNCTEADKGPKCFKCNNYGHIASKCFQTRQLETSVTTVNCVNNVDDKFMSVNIAGLKCHALIDTESDVSLMRNDFYEKINKSKLSSTSRNFTGLRNAITKPSGVFRLKLSIRDDDYEIETYVVPANSMIAELILGRNFLKKAEVIIKKGHMEVKRLAVEDIAAVPEKSVVNTDDQVGKTFYENLADMDCAVVDEIEIAEAYRSRIEKLIKEHTPKKDVQTSVKTKIILKDKDPVSLSHRRLAQKEKNILNNQISD